MLKDNSGQAAVVLLFLAAVGVITYLLITRSFSFEKGLFRSLYYKSPTKAFEETNQASSSSQFANVATWQEKWQSPALPKWEKIVFDCNASVKDTLNLQCTNGFLVSKDKLNSSSPIIINGSFSVAPGGDQSYRVGIGLTENLSTNPYSQILAGSNIASADNILAVQNYEPGKIQNFKIAFTKIGNTQYVYYYLGDDPEPIRKNELITNQPLGISLSCMGLCSFGPLYISGIQTN